MGCRAFAATVACDAFVVLHAADTTLTPRAPFDFRLSAARLAGMRSSPGRRDASGARLNVALRAAGVDLRASLEASGTVEAPRLEVRFEAASPLDDAVVGAASERLRLRLHLDDDLEAFYARASHDVAFDAVLERLYGFRMVEHATPFEAACWALVQQRTPNGFAFATMERLAAALGGRVDGRETADRTFPEPRAFLADARAALLEATNNTRKTDRLVPIAEAFARRSETWMRREPIGTVDRWLRSIHGLGRWSADYVLLRGLGRFERTPWSDTGLLDAIGAVYTGGLRIAKGSARELAERYGPWRGLWAHYLKSYVHELRQTY